MGIDTYHAVQLDESLFFTNGGFRQGRKLQILIAGLMLNNSDMLNVGSKGNFQEDVSTYYGTDRSPNVTLWTGWASQPKPFSDVVSNNVMYTGSPGVSNSGYSPIPIDHEQFPLSEWAGLLFGNDHPWNRGEGYRRLVAYSLPGQALAAKLLRLQSYWNHDAYFDYVDRWMNEDDSANRNAMAAAGIQYNWNSIDNEGDWTNPNTYAAFGQTTLSPFHKEMYLKYRAFASGDPIVSFSVTPDKGPPPLAVSFNASESKDSDGTLVNYAWDFGDGGVGSGVTTAHIYPSEGTYSVRLTITDNDSKTATTKKTILVDYTVSPGLVLYLNFELNSNDLSGNNHTIVCKNGCPPLVPGRKGNAVSFDGSANGPFLESDSKSDLEGMNELTLAFWAKKNSADSGGLVLNKHMVYSVELGSNSLGSTYLFNSNSDRLYLGQNVSTIPEINNTDWHHYVIAFDGSIAAVFVDGRLIKSLPFTGAIKSSPSYNLVIGKNLWGASFNGLLDDVRIYNRALTSEKISALANP